MKKLLHTLIFSSVAAVCYAQQPQTIKLTQLETAKTVESSKAGQIGLTNSDGKQRYAQYVEIDLTPIGFVPTATGNTSNYSEFVTASDSTAWYIDWQGRGWKFPSGGSGSDKNGYYGGNLGNGGDQTIPSVTKSTLTNQLSFFRATDDAGGLVPIRVEVAAGNEPDFISMKNLTDSLVLKRSDQDFEIISTDGLSIWGNKDGVGSDAGVSIYGINAPIVLQADSIMISTVNTAVTGEKTFLLLSPLGAIVKKEGIDSTQLNFDALQSISASGAGPTSYNVDLSGGGGSVTFAEGTNVDLTRSGNTITIASSGGGGGQSLSVATNTTTLSGGGGSMTIAGAGINVATTSGSTITVTGTEVDGLTTNEGSLTVGAGTGSTSIINSNTSGSTGVTLTAGTGLTISESGNVITLTNSSPEVPQTISASGAGPTSYNVDLSDGGGSVIFAEGTNIDLTRSGNTITIASSAGAQTLSVATNTTTLSGGGGSMTIAGAGINVATTSGSTITVTGTEVDGLTTNEGSLTVGAGTGSTSIINSNTSGSTGVTLTAGTGLTISESGNVITLTNSSPEVPQTISASGAGPTSYNVDLSDGGGSVIFAEGTNVDLTRSGNTITIASSAGAQTLSVATNTTTLSGGGGSMTIAGAGINVASTSGTTITVTGTEVDGLTTNEGSLTVGAGTGTTSIINSNTSGSTGVTITAGSGLSISESGNVITLTNTDPDIPQTLSVATNTTTLSDGGGSMTIAGAGINVASTSGSTITVTGTEVDGLITNEGSLTVGAGTGSTSIINSNTSGSTGVTLTAGSGLSISEVGNVITLTNSSPDVPQTLSVATNTTTLSDGGGSMTIAGAGINVASTSGTTITVTGTEVDGLTTNEGSLTVGAGTGSTSIINSNTSGSTGVTLTAGTGLSISEVGNVITVTNSSPDVSQTLSVATNTTTLSGGGGSMTIAGAGINVASTSGSTITVTGTEVDGNVTNEGLLSLIAGGPTTSVINSNTSSSQIVIEVLGSGLTIAETGNTIQLTNTATDTKNGYYGGNAGNGGDATIPSVTLSTLTNQLSFYRATDDAGGLVPIRVEVAAGNEPDFISMKNLTDSLVLKRSDQDFEIISTDGLSIWGNKDGVGSDAGVSIYGINAPIVLQADSIMISTVNTAVTGENTFLMLSPLGTIVKKEGPGAALITDYTASGTFTVNGAKSISVICVGGGGGGGSGRKGAAASNRYGGAGGGAAALSFGEYSISALGDPASITVTVGAGGAGGASVSTNSTEGNNGTNGGESSLSISGSKFILAGGGEYGSRGTSSNSFGGSSQSLGDIAGSTGGSGVSNAIASVPAISTKSGGGGGGASGMNSSDVIGTSAAGGNGFFKLSTGGAGGAAGVAGSNGAAIVSDRYTGGGGGGGGGSTAAAGGNGGNGVRGSGGGGGGASTDSVGNSGAGGTGGNGWVRIIAYY